VFCTAPTPKFWEDTFATFIPNTTVKCQNFFMFRMCWISLDDQLTWLQFFLVLPNKFWGSKSKYATKASMSSQFTVHSSFLWLKIRFYIPALQKLINFHLQLIETYWESNSLGRNSRQSKYINSYIQHQYVIGTCTKHTYNDNLITRIKWVREALCQSNTAQVKNYLWQPYTAKVLSDISNQKQKVAHMPCTHLRIIRFVWLHQTLPQLFNKYIFKKNKQRRHGLINQQA